MDHFLLSKKNEYISSISELEFILSQGEKQLIESKSSGDLVLSRSTLLVGILFTLFTPCLAFAYSHISVFSLLVLASELFCVGCFGLIIALLINIKGVDYQTTGSNPKDLLHDWFFHTYPQAELRQKKLLINQIKSYQKRILINNGINKKRWKRYNICLNISLLLPFASILFGLLFYNIFSC